MVIVRGDNSHKIVTDLNLCIRGNGAEKSSITESTIRCCTKPDIVFVGGLTLPTKIKNEPRSKHLYACKNCGQAHKDEAGNIVQIYGTMPDYFDRLVEKHTEFGITLGSNAKSMGVPLAHR
ncbi:MAG: hypothetical protein AAB515_01235 [Patescibacteria group bacterium]